MTNVGIPSIGIRISSFDILLCYSVEDISALMTPAERLLRWYDRSGRDLPWRKTRTAYKILVSEIMLQQTQVPRVLLFYKKWLKRFPNWKALARASNATVIRVWSGLGYNRRALVLRDIAREIVNYGEPKTEEAWAKLKGIGDYTASALAAFSLHHRTLPIDTNIRRVGDRLLLGVPFPNPKLDGRLKKVADHFLPHRGRFYDVPQALFDLATMICMKKPACEICPMRNVCPAAKKFLSGRVRIPKAMIKKTKERRHRNKPFPDRIYRGRILKLVQKTKIVAQSAVGPAIDPDFLPKLDESWLRRMIKRMEDDGFIRLQKGRISLA